MVNDEIAAPNSVSSSSSISSHAGSGTPEVGAELGALHNLTKEVEAWEGELTAFSLPVARVPCFCSIFLLLVTSLT